MDRLLSFLKKLEDNHLYFKLNKIRDGILVEIAVPGERWEVEYMADGSIVIEKFKSDGHLFDEKEIEILFRDFAD